MTELALAALLGVVFGSFVTLASWRLPREEDVVCAPSRCTACGKTLRVRDLFPVLSWLWNRGRCGQCGARVHWRYPLIELTTAALCVLVVARYGLTAPAWMLLVMVVMLMIMVVVDFEHFLIPSVTHLVLGPLGFAYALHQGAALSEPLLGGAVGLMFGMALRYGFLWLRKKDGLGLGDVKFFGTAGVWLGAFNLVPFFVLSGVFGIALGLVWRVVRGPGRFPFGPVLAAALFVCVLYPDVPAWFWHAQRWLVLW